MLLPFVSFQDCHGRILPIFFTTRISTHWMFAFAAFSALSNLEIHLMDPLLRVLFWINVSNVIVGGSKVVRESPAGFLSLEISAQAAEVFFPTGFLDGLRSCLRFYLFLCSCLLGFFRILLVPKGSLFSWGSKILGGTAPRLQAMS